MSRRGQAQAGGAALLLTIIAVMIILYLVFLPSSQRAKILGEQQQPPPGQSPGGPPGGTKAVLLSQNVGQINPPSPNEVEHTLPSFTIFTETNAKELARKNTMEVENGLFSDKQGQLQFSYNPTEINDPILSFNARRSGGKLIILLNGEVIFNSELESGSPDPVQLPESLLQSRNTLVFKASSPGAAFWSSHMHDLRNIIVSGKVTDRSGSTADQHFSIPQREYEAMQFAELKFLPNCNPDSTGRLRIRINRKELYSGFADCGVPNKVEVAKELLKEGDNRLRFVSEKGQYTVDSVKITSKIEGQDVPVFYFNLNRRAYDRVYMNDALLFITIRFAGRVGQAKTGVLNINGFETTFRTEQNKFQTQVNPEFLTQGPNSVMIIPQGKALNVAELRVELG